MLEILFFHEPVEFKNVPWPRYTMQRHFFSLVDLEVSGSTAFSDRGERLTFNTRCIEPRRLQRESVCGGSTPRGLAIDASRVNRVPGRRPPLKRRTSSSSSSPFLFHLESRKTRASNDCGRISSAMDRNAKNVLLSINIATIRVMEVIFL